MQLTVPCRVAHRVLTSVHAQYPYSFYQPPFPHGSLAHQGHVLFCILARSVTIAARSDQHACWPVIYSDNKQSQMDNILHLSIYYKISRYQNMVSWWIYLETQRTSGIHYSKRLLLIWKRCDLKGPCLCFLIQLRESRDTNLTMKKQLCLNNHSILKTRDSHKKPGSLPTQWQLTIWTKLQGKIIHLYRKLSLV